MALADHENPVSAGKAVAAVKLVHDHADLIVLCDGLLESDHADDTAPDDDSYDEMARRPEHDRVKIDPDGLGLEHRRLVRSQP